MLSTVFLKGYQWPFDVNKIYGDSSVIDLLVYQETILKGRRVFLDFTKNPGTLDISFNSLYPVVYEYLKQAGALSGTPINRLKQMNEPEIRYYQEHPVDLYCDKLKIAVCAQHNNGGVATNAYWETNIHGLFAVGEACGSHGVTRPGGTALNAGQVGAIRAAECIHLRKLHEAEIKKCPESLKEELRKEVFEFIKAPELVIGKDTLSMMWIKAAKRMSAYGGMIRNREDLMIALKMTDDELKNYLKLAKKTTIRQLPLFYRLRDMLISQKMYLWAMLDYVQSGARSRNPWLDECAFYTWRPCRRPRYAVRPPRPLHWIWSSYPHK